ncbi:MAG: histidinol-phosphatase HisJ family protein [bacterium]
MMEVRADYHIHTALCRHATGDMEAYVLEAEAKGLKEIGFSDHAPAEEGFDPNHRMVLSQLPEYVKRVSELRKAFPAIAVKLGLEVDIHPGFESLLETMLREFPVDYVIGSVHFIDGTLVHMEHQESSIEGRNRLVRRYYEILEQGIRSGLIDIVGHLDLVKWAFPGMKEHIRLGGNDILRAIQEEDLILEVNTSGWRKPPREVYPSPDLIRAACSMDIPVCFGSDAHSPEEVGADFDRGTALLEDAGYCREVLGNHRLRIFLPEEEKVGSMEEKPNLASSKRDW